VRKHPKDLLPFLWDADPNEVRDAVPSEARDASLTLGRTDRVKGGASLALGRAGGDRGVPR